MPVSSRTSRAAVSSPVSPGFGPPLGSPVTRVWRGVMTRTSAVRAASSMRTATPPWETSRTTGPRSPPRRPSERSVDIPLQRRGIVDHETAAPLGDDARALERGEEPAGGFARGARELGDLRLRDDEQDVAVAGPLRPRLVDELGDDGGHAGL